MYLGGGVSIGDDEKRIAEAKSAFNSCNFHIGCRNVFEAHGHVSEVEGEGNWSIQKDIETIHVVCV